MLPVGPEGRFDSDLPVAWQKPCGVRSPAGAGSYKTTNESIRPERVADPLDPRFVARHDVDADHVETHRPVRIAAVATEKQGGGARELALFSRINRGRRRPETVRLSIANFDEDQALAVLHHEVDLTQAAAEIAIDQSQLVGAQKLERERLGAAT